MNPTDLSFNPADVSITSLFWHAHWVIKLVVIGLLVCSVWIWAIVVEKYKLYIGTRRAMDAFEHLFWAGQELEDHPRQQLYQHLINLDSRLAPRDPKSMAALFVAGMRELKRYSGKELLSPASLQQRIEKVMDANIAREIERLERRLLVLATVGSTGPFIGLFGTVWGIMTSFQSIALAKNTSLAVVAPGIAEALFATAVGLVAAIPATIFYNKFVTEVNKQAVRLEGFADEFSAMLSRFISERG